MVVSVSLASFLDGIQLGLALVQGGKSSSEVFRHLEKFMVLGSWGRTVFKEGSEGVLPVRAPQEYQSKRRQGGPCKFM